MVISTEHKYVNFTFSNVNGTTVGVDICGEKIWIRPNNNGIAYLYGCKVEKGILDVTINLPFEKIDYFYSDEYIFNPEQVQYFEKNNVKSEKECLYVFNKGVEKLVVILSNNYSNNTRFSINNTINTKFSNINFIDGFGFNGSKHLFVGEKAKFSKKIYTDVIRQKICELDINEEDVIILAKNENALAANIISTEFHGSQVVLIDPITKFKDYYSLLFKSYPENSYKDMMDGRIENFTDAHIITTGSNLEPYSATKSLIYYCDELTDNIISAFISYLSTKIEENINIELNINEDEISYENPYISSLHICNFNDSTQRFSIMGLSKNGSIKVKKELLHKNGLLGDITIKTMIYCDNKKYTDTSMISQNEKSSSITMDNAGHKYRSVEHSDSFDNFTVSIVVTAYGTSPFLLDTLKSINVQSYEDIKVYVVNNNDLYSYEYYSVLKQVYDLKDKKFDYIILDTKIGGSAQIARNAVNEVLDTKYVKFIDDDDLLNYDAIENLVNLQKKYQVGLVYGKENDLIEGNIKNKDLFPGKELKGNNFYSLISIQYRVNPSTLNSMMLSSEYLKTGGWDIWYQRHQDVALLLKYTQQNDSVCGSFVTGNYRIIPKRKLKIREKLTPIFVEIKRMIFVDNFKYIVETLSNDEFEKALSANYKEIKSFNNKEMNHAYYNLVKELRVYFENFDDVVLDISMYEKLGKSKYFNILNDSDHIMSEEKINIYYSKDSFVPSEILRNSNVIIIVNNESEHEIIKKQITQTRICSRENRKFFPKEFEKILDIRSSKW